MNIYYANLALLTVYCIVAWLLDGQRAAGPHSRAGAHTTVLCFLFAAHWIVISGLRHYGVGADTYAYLDRYLTTAVRSWPDLFSDAGLYYGNLLRGVKDPGYPIVEKALQSIGLDYRAFLFFIALVFTIPLAVLICRDSKNIYLSIIIYSALFFEFFSITGHRQTIATALVLMLGLGFILKRQPARFLLLLLIAASIHKSVLVFAPAYFFVSVRPTRRLFVAVAVVLPLLFIFRDEVVSWLTSVSGYEQHAGAELSAPITFSWTLGLVAAATFWRLDHLVGEDRKVWFYVNCLLASLLSLPLVFANPVAMRVVQYYSIFLIWLIPELVSSLQGPTRVGTVVTTGAVLCALFVITEKGGDYAFFWEPF